MSRRVFACQRLSRFWFILPLLLAIFHGHAQSILREYWLGIQGGAVSDLTGNAAFPNTPTDRDFPTIFEAPSNWADNYGTRMRGYLKPPTTGSYTFWIAGDDQCELWLSTDSSPASKMLIARVATWTGPRVWEDISGGNAQYQKSTPVQLIAGNKYYIEALQKEGGGGDCLAVGWQLPNAIYERPIPGARLEPFQISDDPPTIQTQPTNLIVYEGDPAKFTVLASGMEPLTYQWQRDGFDLPGEHTASYILTTVELQDSGAKFRCVITNPKGTAASDEATLTVKPEITPPKVQAIAPAAGATVRSLTQVEVTFSEPVQGLDASDLLVNGVAATNVIGAAAGPYLFFFPAVASGAVTFSFAIDSGIRDLSANENLFASYSWSCTVDPNAITPKIRISEIDASNENGLLDEDGEAVDWIEIENYGAVAVNLNGWSLTDNKDDPNEWIFPNRALAANTRLVIFASGKDRHPASGKLHTNFLLAGNGEFLGLYDGSSPRQLISSLDPFPEQRTDFSYGLDSTGNWKYFKAPTPGAANGTSAIVGVMAPPHFSSERGFYGASFQVYITTDQPGAQIYFTTNGGDPSGASGILYTNALTIAATTTLRASVVKTNYLPSAPATHTFLYNISAQRRSLPAISIVTPTNNLFGPSGILGISGGTYTSDGTWQPVNAGDYHNPSQHGLAWERPMSIEYFWPTNDDQFQIDCGVRIQGSDYMRPRYQPASKFSYRFYFRGDYGSGKLEYPLFNSPLASFDQLVERAGHNDDTNPFLKDELMRRLLIDCGQVGSHGIFHTLYVNGVYKGYYNLVERPEKHFCQAYHGSILDWDVLEQGQVPVDGDNLNFSQMMSFIRGNAMTNNANYLEAMRRLDLTNFVDYLLVNIYGANGDWPGNNWRAGRERSPNGVWRFYLWDAEFAFGTYGQSYTWDSFANQLSETSEIPTIYKALKTSPEFRLFWADRVQKHFYNGGALVDTNILRNFNALKSQLTNIITGFDNSIASTWIPNRRKTITNLFRTYSLAGAPGAPNFNQFGGRVPAGFQLSMTSAATGPAVGIYYTTDGSDPRMMFTGAVSANAKLYAGPITLDGTTLVKARMLTNSAWSALTEAAFEVSDFGAPIRFTEINYNPPGGDAYEFIELKNLSAAPIDLSGMSFEGINFRFPDPTVLAPGSVIVLASGVSPTAFAQRYPGVIVTGYFLSSSLSNGGERITLKDRLGNIVASVDYDDQNGWPTEPDGGGYTLELADREIDPNSPAAWRRSQSIYGSPGYFQDAAPASVRLSEIMPANGNSPGWVEIENTSDAAINLQGFALGDVTNSRHYIFPATISINGGDHYVVPEFPIGLNGGTLFLFDANTNRLDAVTIGPQLTSYSVALIDGVWKLATPTPNTENSAASVEPSTSVKINEWLANTISGGDDWLELYNSGAAPAALQGMTLSVSNAIYQIPTLTFIPPGGFVQLFATEKTGANQLGFKLPAGGATIRLYDAQGTQIDTVSYAAQIEGVSEGRIPDGGATIVKFRGSISPGAPNYVVDTNSPLVINEVMARNIRAVIDPMGGTSDWVELHNSGNAMLLDGFSLSSDESSKGSWKFPTGVTIPSDGYLVVWFDKTHPPSTKADSPFNAGQGLSAEGGAVYLFNPQGQVIDQLEFGIQAPDLSIGRVNSTWTLLANPTPGATNSAAATTASSSSVRINEWSPTRSDRAGWVELYNSNSIPVSLAGMSFTDELNLAGQKKFVMPSLSFLGPRRFGRWFTSGDSSAQSGEINFSISALGESLRLYNGASIADTVSFGLLDDGSVLGRMPDATGSARTVIPTPLAPNYIGIEGILINEIAPVENRIELRNLTDSDIDLTYWWLSNDPLFPQNVRFAEGAKIPARGYLVVNLPTEAQLDSVFGGTVLVARGISDGTPTGEQVRLDYGPAVAGMVYGPVHTYSGPQTELLSGSTFGKANAAPQIGPIIISEIMYHPSGEDDETENEFIELYNATSASVSLRGWRVNGGVQFNFADESTLEPNSTALLVSFDPSDSEERLKFAARYHLASGASLVGPLRGKLGNSGDEIFLERHLSVAPNGYVPFVTVDRIVYSDQMPWPITADGSGASLQRLRANDLGIDPLNWIAAAPTPLSFANGTPTDRDGDGMPDIWETAHGLDMYDPTDALQDLDGDGLTNLAEFQLGSDPNDPSDGLAAGVSWNASQPVLEFNASPGIIYHIEFRQSLTQGAWQTISTIGPVDAAQNVSLPIVVDGTTQGFYRIAK